MIGDSRNLNDVMKIYQLRAKQKNELNKKNKNFEEFKRVYGDVLTKNEPARQKPVHKQIQNSLTLIDVKTIQLEMPVLGKEAAILQCQKPKPVPRKSVLKKNLQNNFQDVCTQDLIDNLKDMEKVAEVSKDVDKNPIAFLENTDRDLNMAAKQLEKIKEILNSRKTLQKRPKTPTYKSKRKDRHCECVSKKYLSTLTTMKKHLQKLEEKYFSKPHLVYKNVNDTFTQSSKVEMLYENNRNPEDLKIDEALRGIKDELDNIVNLENEDQYLHVTPRDISFTEPSSKHLYTKNNLIGENSEVVLKEFDFDSPPRDVIFKKQNIDETYITAATTVLGNTYSNIQNNSRNFSFKKLVATNDIDGRGTPSYASLIDTSESRFKKLRNMKQDIVDIEAICKGISEIGNSSDDESDAKTNPVIEKSEKQHVDKKESDKGLLDDSELQESILKSSYLMKEFQITPSVKIFSENNSFVRSKNKFFDVTEKCSSSCNNSITNIIENLNFALKNSIYKPVDI